ncbi:MAG: hypothetical protein AAF968_22225 [Pseudomonadota bacterium]
MSDRKPEDTLRDGALKATIWRNQSEKGDYFSANFSKTYRDERGEFRDTQSFSAGDLLRVSELGRRAHNRIRDLKRDVSRDPDRQNGREQQRRDRPTPDRGPR